MQILRQIVEVGGDPSELGGGSRKIELVIPETVGPGSWEVVVTFQPARLPEPSPLMKFKSLFGFLSKRVDPVAFQRELRNEWDR